MRPAAPLLPQLEANSFEDLLAEWQAAIMGAERNLPKLQVVSGD